MLRQSSFLRPLILLLGMALLLGACSRVGLAYRNLDWLIPWRLDDYLNLDNGQKAWLKPRLQAHLQWHCSTQLSGFVDWLARTRTLLDSAQPDAGRLGTQFAEADGALKRIAVEITPTSIVLLRRLDEAQIQGLYAKLDADNREDREKFVDITLQQQIANRAERMGERLRPWFGTLNEGQRARVAQWAQDLGDQNRLWLDNRQRWQDGLRQALDERHGARFPERITRLLQDRQSFHDAAYQEAYLRSRQALASLLADLVARSDSPQREHLDKRLASLQNELQAQRCDATVG